MKSVGARASDSVDLPSGETSLAHVIGGCENLELLHGVEWERASAFLAAGRTCPAAQPKEIVVRSAVDENVVEPIICAGYRSAHDARSGLNELCEVAREKGEI